MRQVLAVVVALGVVVSASPRAQVVGQAWDATFRVMPKPDNIEATMKSLSTRPHHVGSAYDKDNAQWLLAQFKAFGWDAQIETFDVLFPMPRERLLELVAPTRFTAKLESRRSPDPPRARRPSSCPPTTSRSTATSRRRSYVNGRPEDYDVLKGSASGATRSSSAHGASWRGIKPKVAGEHGAIGCLIYSDPRDDDYFGEPTFPDGPMRPKDGAQRGSVMDMPLYPGDPLTPNVGATPSATRLAVKDAPTLTKIPVLPISPRTRSRYWPRSRAPWRRTAGAARSRFLSHRPKPTRAHLKVAFNWDTKTLYDVIAKMQGRTFLTVDRPWQPSRRVGQRRSDPSAASVLLEEARARRTAQAGWAPKRTLVYAAWDGEEPALLGSTEWVETHGADLQAHAVVYLNTDGNGRGFLSMEGSHTLEHFINDVARDITDPETSTSVWKRARAQAISRAATLADKNRIRDREDLRIGALGSGSDFTPFLQHAGIASIHLGYGGRTPTASTTRSTTTTTSRTSRHRLQLRA